jgi:uncharacterized protein involved in exopolysaccharide biosynthesis
MMNQMPITYQPDIQEDEIDLRELFATIWSAKRFIAIFVIIVTLAMLIFALAQPNTYTVETKLVPIESTKGSSLGGLGALASMAGVSIGGGEVGPSEAFNTLLNDYGSMAWWIKKEQWHKSVINPDTSGYIFALGNRWFYDFFHPKSSEPMEEPEAIYNTYLAVKKMLSISEDKKSGMLTLSAKNPDRELAKKLLESFLTDASTYLIQNDLANNNERLEYYKKSLTQVQDLQIRSSIASQVSALIQSDILLKSSPYYKVKMITKPAIPHTKGKSGPKRALILIVAMITSTILAIFIVFFRNFLKSDTQLRNTKEN